MNVPNLDWLDFFFLQLRGNRTATASDISNTSSELEQDLRGVQSSLRISDTEKQEKYWEGGGH